MLALLLWLIGLSPVAEAQWAFTCCGPSAPFTPCLSDDICPLTGRIPGQNGDGNALKGVPQGRRRTFLPAIAVGWWTSS